MRAQGVALCGVCVVEQVQHGAAERQADGGKPGSLDVGLNQVGVGEVEPWGNHLARNHPLRVAEEVLVVTAADRAVGGDKGRLATPAGAAAINDVINSPFERSVEERRASLPIGRKARHS